MRSASAVSGPTFAHRRPDRGSPAGLHGCAHTNVWFLDSAKALENIPHHAGLELGLDIAADMSPIASTAAVGNMRAVRFNAVRRRLEDLQDVTPRESLLQLRDCNLDNFSRQNSGHERRSPIRETTNALATGGNAVNVHTLAVAVHRLEGRTL